MSTSATSISEADNPPHTYAAPGEEAVALINRRLARIHDAVEELRRAEDIETAEFQNFSARMDEEETTIRCLMDELDATKEELVEQAEHENLRLRTSELSERIQRLLWTEACLSLMEQHTMERVNTLWGHFSGGMVGVKGSGWDRQSVRLFNHPTQLQGSHPSLEESLGVRCNETLCAPVRKFAPLSPECERLMAVIRSSSCDSETVSEVLAQFGDSGSHIVNKADEEGNTALHVLCGKHNFSTAVLKLLLKAGADASAKNAQGRSPFHIACLNTSDGATQLKRALLGAGCDVNERTDDGETAAHMCATDDRHFDSLQFLCSVDADLSAGAFFQGVWCTPIKVAQLSGERASRTLEYLKLC